MYIRPKYLHLPLLAGLASALYSVSASAYIGPGAGLGMMGSLFAIGVVALLVLLGLIIYPIRMISKKRREKLQQSNNTES